MFPHHSKASFYSLTDLNKNVKTSRVKSLDTNDVSEKSGKSDCSCGEFSRLLSLSERKSDYNKSRKRFKVTRIILLESNYGITSLKCSRDFEQFV